jgi:hypothetical protein
MIISRSVNKKRMTMKNVIKNKIVKEMIKKIMRKINDKKMRRIDDFQSNNQNVVVKFDIFLILYFYCLNNKFVCKIRIKI